MDSTVLKWILNILATNCIINADPLLQTVGRDFVFVTPVCVATPTLLIVPQFPGTCRVDVITSDWQETAVIDNGFSIKKFIPCKPAMWAAVDEVGGRISASCDIVVYLEYDQNDNYLIHPVTASGHMFTAITPVMQSRLQTFVVIYAIQNNTNISINISSEKQKKSNIFNWQLFEQTLLNIALNENEAFYIKCECDLTGVFVTSSRYFGIVTGSFGYKSTGVRTYITRPIMIEELSPDVSSGRHFIFPIPSSISLPVWIKMFGNEVPCEVVIELDNTNTSKIVEMFPFSMPIYTVDFFRVRTNTSVAVALTLQISNVVNTHQELMYVPPVSLCLPSVSFYDSEQPDGQDLITTMSFWGKYGESLYYDYELLSSLANVSWVIDDFYIYTGITRPQYIGIYPSIEEMHIPTVCGWVQRQSNNSSTVYSLGMRVTKLFDACINTIGHADIDGIDNDCDGAVDEEILNNLDDDGDTQIDEDIGRISKDVDEDTNRFRRKHTSEMTVSAISVIISITVAISAVIAFIGGMFVADQILAIFGDTPPAMPRSSRVSPLHPSHASPEAA